MQASFWDDKRPAGVPADIEIAGFTSVVDVFLQSCRRYGDSPAFSNMLKSLSYRELDRLSGQFAAYLQHETDLEPGDRIAIQMPNLIQYPIAVFGALRAGLVVVNTNPLYTPAEMVHQYEDAGVKALVFVELFADRVEQVQKDYPLDHLIMVRMGDLQPCWAKPLINGAVKYIKKMVPVYALPQAVQFEHALRVGGRLCIKPVHFELDQVALLQYTGGTTGVAKGAKLSHRNLIANMQQVKAQLSQLDESGVKLLDTGCEGVVAPLPLYHIYSFTVHCMCAMVTGNHSILVTNPRDINGFIKLLRKQRFTGFIGLNTLFVALMNHPEFRHLDFSALKFTISGGTALVKDTADRWRKITGCPIAEGYGLSECSPVVCINPGYGHEQIGSVGLPVPHTALKTVDEAGAECGIGEAGELCVKGPQVMQGYWQRPDASGEVFDDEGWLRTGDIAVIEADGFVRIVDRKKDLIIVSGFNVYPNEVEAVALAHPAVDQAAVIGVPDKRSGEAVRLYVVSKDPTLTADALRQFCRASLTGYKVPNQVEFRSELPMTNVGKILRRELKRQYLAEHQ